MSWRPQWVFAVVVLMLFVGCDRDPRVRAARHSEKAAAALEKKDNKAALIEVRAALKDDPDNARANYISGMLNLQSGFLPSAYRDFNHAIKVDPNLLDAHLALADLLLQAGDAQAANEAIGIVLNNPAWKDNSRANLIRAESLLIQKQTDQASAIIGQVIAADANNSRALMDRALLRLTANDTAGAEADLTRAQQSSPDSLVPILALTAIFEREGDPAKSEKLLRENVARHNVAQNNYVLGVWLARHGKTDEAEKTFKSVRDQAGNDKRFRGILAQFYMATNRLQEAENEYKGLVQSDPNDVVTAQALARFYIAQNRIPEAKELLNTLVKSNPKDWNSVLLKGQLEIANGDIDQGIVDVQMVQKLNPSSSVAALELANAMLKTGQTDRAKAALEQMLVKWPDNVRAHLMLAEIEINTGRPDEAERNINQAISSGYNGPRARMMLATIRAGRGDVDGAADALQHLLEAEKSPAERLAIQENLAWVRLKQKRYADSLNIARDMLKVKPDLKPAMLIISATYMVQGHPEGAVNELTAWSAKYPSATALIEIGNLELQQRKFDAAEASFKKALERDPKSNLAKLGVALVYGGTNRMPQAIEGYTELTKLDPSNAFFHLRLGMADEVVSNWAGAQAAYEKALSLDGGNPIIRNNLAWLYAEHGGNLDVALQLAQGAVSTAPKQPSFADTLGWIYVKKGAYDAALQQLNSCVAAAPNNPEYRYHLAVAYSKSGRKDKAKEAVTAALKVPQFPSRADAKQLLDELSR